MNFVFKLGHIPKILKSKPLLVPSVFDTQLYLEVSLWAGGGEPRLIFSKIADCLKGYSKNRDTEILELF